MKSTPKILGPVFHEKSLSTAGAPVPKKSVEIQKLSSGIDLRKYIKKSKAMQNTSNRRYLESKKRFWPSKDVEYVTTESDRKMP